jgi:ElaB/YqjD/DUF883 family membrane-anchored ribosome-binding protein
MATRKSSTEQAEHDDAQPIIDRAEEAAHDTIDQVADGARTADRKVREQARRAEERAEAAVADVRSQAGRLYGETSDLIRANPLLSVGIALVVGALAQRITSRK